MSRLLIQKTIFVGCFVIQPNQIRPSVKGGLRLTNKSLVRSMKLQLSPHLTRLNWNQPSENEWMKECVRLIQIAGVWLRYASNIARTHKQQKFKTIFHASALSAHTQPDLASDRQIAFSCCSAAAAADCWESRDQQPERNFIHAP